MGRHQYLNEDEYEVNLKDFEPQPGEFLNNLTVVLTCWNCSASCYSAATMNSECRNSVVIFTSCILYSK